MAKKKIIVGGLICVCVVSVETVALAALGHDKKTEAELRASVDESQAFVTSAVSDIEEMLSAENRSARVYDDSGTFLFDLNIGGSLDTPIDLPESFKTIFQSEVLDAVPLTVIDVNEWIDSQTIYGGLFSSKEKNFTTGSLGYILASWYNSYTESTYSEEQLFAVACALDAKFDSDSLLDAIAILGTFGPYRGLETASSAMFGKSADKLNDNQISYLMYSYSNDDASWDDFVTRYPDSTGGASTSVEFGFSSTNGDTYWYLQQKILEELESIKTSVDLPDAYSVQIAVDSALQAELQKQLDDGLKASIELSTNGQTVLDGVLCVIDPSTGFVSALVGGRSVNDLQKEFYLDSVSFIGNLEEVLEKFEEDSNLTYATLMEYEDSSGQQQLAAFSDLVYSDQLSLIGLAPTVESTIKLDELNNFFTRLFVDNDARYITEIRSAEDELVYSAKASNSEATKSPSVDLRSLLSNNASGTESVYEQVCEKGYVCCSLTSEYIFVSILGTNSSGYTVTDSDYDYCLTTAFNAMKSLSKFFPKELKYFDPDGIVSRKLAVAQQKNVDKLTEVISSWITDLETMQINSIGTRVQFEEAYAHYMAATESFRGLLTEEFINHMQANIDAIRIERTDELLQFVS